MVELLIQEPRGPTRLAQAANLNYQKSDEFLGLLLSRELVQKEVRSGHEVLSATLKGKTMYMNWVRIFEELNLS